VVLADGDGLLVVGSGQNVDVEAMAAVAPIAANDHRPPEGMLGLMTRGEPLRVWDVELEGATYYLAAVGGEAGAPRDAGQRLTSILLT